MQNNPDPIPVHANRSATRTSGWLARSFRPFRTATLRGLAIILPPLLTIIFFLWAWNVIEKYVLTPVESALTTAVAHSIEEVYRSPDDAPRTMQLTRIGAGKWIPTHVYQSAEENAAGEPLKTTKDYYRQYVKAEYLERHLFIPAFLALFLALLYLLGKLLAAGIGRFFLHFIENLITRLPVIRNVYSAVKQVTDFAFNENEMNFTRIVAVEYPRRGIWSMGFVTGEGMQEIKVAAGEPILTVLMPTSPMPATGFTISIPKSETIDLNITIDQAIQFCVSCGVVVPEHQQSRNVIDGEVQSRFQRIANQNASNEISMSGNSDPTEGDSAHETQKN